MALPFPPLWAKLFNIFTEIVFPSMHCVYGINYKTTFWDEDRLVAKAAASNRQYSIVDAESNVCRNGGMKAEGYQTSVSFCILIERCA